MATIVERGIKADDVESGKSLIASDMMMPHYDRQKLLGIRLLMKITVSLMFISRAVIA